MAKRNEKNKTVLVCVLKSKRDLEIILSEQWYRIPVEHLSAKKFEYLAFYQPITFGAEGKRIVYFARIVGRAILKRVELMPDEPNHPRANKNYARLRLSKIKKLFFPVVNSIPRRVNFAFTTLDRLLNSKNLLELYSVEPTEQILEAELKRAKIKHAAQKYAICGKNRYRPDFTIICKDGKIAIECDNAKAHSGKLQNTRDKMKNACLKEFGWTVIRFSENEILLDIEKCASRIKQTIRRLGGIDL